MERHTEEDEEDYIDLDDISIYDNDPNYEPSEEEVIYYAERLGFDVENDPKEFLTIAYQALKAPLPENWRRALLKSKDELVYINLEDQTIHLYTDIDEMAYKYYVEEKEKWVKSKQEKESRTKVIPRSKIPPLNSNNQDEELEKKIKKKKKKSKLPEKKKNVINNLPSNSNDNLNTIIKGYGTTNQYDPYNIPTKYDSGVVNNNNNTRNDRHNTVANIEETLMTQNNNDDLANVIHNENHLNSYLDSDQLIGKDDKDIPPHQEHEFYKIENSNKNLLSIDTPKNYNDSTNSIHIENLKKSYFNQKMKELKDFETQIRETFNKSQEDYKQNRTQFKMNLSEEYERRITLTKRKMKDEFDHILIDEVKELEDELENQMDYECKEYENKLNYDYHTNEDFDLENENKIVELEGIKSHLIHEIENQKQNQKINFSDYNLNEYKLIMEEKYSIEKNNIQRTFEMLELEIQIEEENKFNSQSEFKKKEINKNLELQERIIISSQNKLLEDYSKALDDEYQIESKTILKELENKYNKDLINYKNDLDNEKKDKIILFKNEILELEKEYYFDLNNQRESNRKDNNYSDKNINDKFENVLNNYESLKKKINLITDQICQKLINFLRNLIETQEITEDYLSIENKLEEFVMNLLDDYMIKNQRRKSHYEILEIEYKEKSLILEYYLEISKFLTNFLKENPTKKINIETNKLEKTEEKINSELIKFIKDLQKEYKKKYSEIKEKRIFNFNFNFNENSLINKNNFNNSKFRFNSNSLLISNNLSKDPTINNSNIIKPETPVFNLNKSINLKNIPTLTQRYNEENINSEIQIENKYENLSSKSNFNNFYLSNEIISKLDSNDKNIILIINDFLFTEKERINKENLDLTNRKKIFENLNNTIDNLKLSSSPNNQLMTYIQMLEEDREKIRNDERSYYYKKNIFDKIESNIEDCFIYTKNNINFDSKREMIIDKLNMIRNQIDDYYEAYSELKNVNFNRNFEMANEMNLPQSKITASNFNINNIQNSRTGNSTEFFISQKLNKENLNLYNTDNTNNTFNNFYTLYNRKSLHDDIYL